MHTAVSFINFLTFLYYIHVAAWLSAGPPLTLQASILLSTDAFVFFLQCYISAHKRQAEDKDNTGCTETKLKTTKRLFVYDNYVYIAAVFVFSCKEVINLLFPTWW